MTEWGSLALVEDADDINKTSINLPGVIKGDFSSRNFKPEIQVNCVQFSPTSRSWCACSTEGLLIYSLDSTLIFRAEFAAEVCKTMSLKVVVACFVGTKTPF